MAPSAEQLQQEEKTAEVSGPVWLREGPREAEEDRSSMQGGVDTVRRESFAGGYFSGEPPLPRFSPPSFTSLIDLCRDISALQVDSPAPPSPEPTEEEFVLLYNEEPDTKEKVRRSSSLKSARTSGQKKIVRFADVLGLDLADVHTFLDEVPRIPRSAFRDLKNKDLCPPKDSPPTVVREERTLVARFAMPGSQPAFAERLARNKVLLEHAYATSTLGLAVRGTVRVANLHFNKHVAVRYSADNWQSFTEVQASYVETPHDGFSDRFGFTIPVFGDLRVGGRLEFALKYVVLGEEAWDNNGGHNYLFECVPESRPPLLPSSLALESWGSFY